MTCEEFIKRLELIALSEAPLLQDKVTICPRKQNISWAEAVKEAEVINVSFEVVNEREEQGKNERNS